MSRRNKIILLTTLFISLTVNAVLLGAGGYAAYKFRGAKDGNWIETRIAKGERYFVGRLEGEDKAKAKEIFDKRRPELRASLAELRQARRQFRKVMITESPEPDDFISILDNSEAAASGVNKSFHNLLRDMATNLSAEARQNIGKRWRRHHRDEDDERYHRDEDDESYHRDEDDERYHRDGDDDERHHRYDGPRKDYD
jgi:hypothetical protein